MRPYRGLTKEGKWIYGWYIQAAGDSYILPTLYAEIFKDLDNYKVIPETVGQFTGLKDKNGTEIYEGDIIIPFDNFSWIKVICFGEFQAHLSGELNVGFYGKNKVGTQYPLSPIEGEFEVIGNIHQNPKLLEQENG